MNNRIKLIRDSMGLTQDAFGKRIGSARNTIANYETGNRTPSNAVITSICREFNVNEAWLRTGEGEMFVPKTRDDEIAELTLMLLSEESDSFKNRFISALCKLSEEQWELLADMIDLIATKKEQD